MLRSFVNSILFIAALQLLSSCSAFYMANPCIDPIVFTKPAYRDSAFVSNYVGGKLNRSVYLNQYENLSDNYFGQLYLFQTQTNKFYNMSYGAFGYYGRIGVEKDVKPTYEGYYGGGVSADIQLNLPIQNIDLRLIGFKTSVIYEDGEYYRNKYTGLEEIGIYTDKFACNISQTSGMTYKFRKSSLGVDLSYGYTYTIPHMLMDITYSAIVNYSTPKFTVYVQKSGALMVSNDDLVIGLNYRLP